MSKFERRLCKAIDYAWITVCALAVLVTVVGVGVLIEGGQF